MADAVDFSKTQRIVLLIDLNPLLQSQNPNHNYIPSILTTSNILLSFASLSSSLFSFKLFFSSLSPLLSASTLHRLLPNHPSTSLYFNSPSQTLDSLSQTLNSISSTQFTYSPSNASQTASSLLQLAQDYDWESDIENLSGKRHHDLMGTRSNLIILLSPVSRSLKCLAEFMCVDVNDNSLRNVDDFGLKFCDCFRVVNDAFNSRDIHFCWVDIHSHEEKLESIDYIGDEIRKFGWGFCSADLVVLGSALVPFGLIYPNIGVSSKLLDCHRLNNRIRGQLNLEISDISGKPLECKCCDLELLHMKASSSRISEAFTFPGNLNRLMKLQVTAVRRYNECEKFEEFASDHFLVQSVESDKKGNNGSDIFFADRVLELLATEKSELFKKNSVPTWQIFLDFLYRDGYWALLSLSNSNGDSFMGILKPFTVHSAFISIIDNNRFLVQNGGSNLFTIENVVSQGDTDSQKGISPLGKYVHLGDRKRRNNKKYNFRDLTWSLFSKAAYAFSDLDLAEVYFANGFKKSKKLKFLKCWMKQVKNHSLSRENIPDGSCQNQQKETNLDEKLTASHQESDEPLSRHMCSDQSRMQEDAAFESCPETSEAFFSNLPKKIQHGLESDGVDLKILAERLVNSSIYWLHQKYETLENLDESCTMKVTEITKLLLREPKDLKECKDNNSESTSKYLAREYELQILLRMEILQSELAGSMKGVMKMKLVKQICSLLEIVQYLVEGGFHGDVSLFDYVERSIKTRYSEKLGDVVNKIYDQMDLLPFGEENEAQALLLNNEDNNQSWRDKHETTTSKKVQESLSLEDESSHPLENVNKGHTKDEHARKLNEARERRERARRFVSFTSRMPDLQKVWAPKQSKSMKVKPESKRKKRRGPSYSVVCETPLTVNKPSCSNRENKSNGCNSVSKALFQDDR